jgi:hypothetical protein
VKRIPLPLLRNPRKTDGGAKQFLALSVVRAAAFALLAAAGFSYPAVVTQPDPLEIVRKSVEAIETNWKQASNYSFVDREAQSKKEAEPTVKSYEVLMIDGSPYRRLVAIDDKPLSLGEQAEEDRKMRAEVEKREHETDREEKKRMAKYLRDRKREHDMIREMVNAFEFRLAGEETIHGHDCWVLDTSPKPGYEPKDRESRVLLGMTGRLWIDKDQYQWVKARAEVVKPVSFFGFLAKVGPGTHFLLEQEPIANNLWVPKHFNMQVSASALGFLNEDSTDDETFQDYKPMSQSLAELRASK